MTERIKAATLQVGDIVHISTGVAGRVDEILAVTDKTISYRFTYTRCDSYPSSVGTSRSNSHRLQTVLRIERP